MKINGTLIGCACYRLLIWSKSFDFSKSASMASSAKHWKRPSRKLVAYDTWFNSIYLKMVTNGEILNWVETVDKGNEEEITAQCSRLSEGVKSGQINLLDAVVTAERLLTAPDTGTRSAIVSAFAKVVRGAGEALSMKEFSVFVEFFSAKLMDHFSIVPGALQGIFALSKLKALPEGTAPQILATMFREVNCQSLLQPERRCFYLIIRDLFELKTKELQMMGADLVLGLVQAMDSERDPRNLLLLFRFLPSFLKVVDPGPLDEEIFEVMSAYFPIEFNPPPNDPQGVSRDALSESLRLSLAASPRLAQHVIPFMLEKLEATQVSARTEAFLALECCCATYSADQLNPYLEAFWTAVRKEIFLAVGMGPDRDRVEKAALDFLAALIRLVATQNPPELPAKRILSRIIEDCKSHLQRPEHRLVFPSAQILSALAASPVAAVIVLDQTISLLAELCMTHTVATQRSTLLEVLQRLLRACQQAGNESVIKNFAPKLLNFLSHFLSEEDQSLKAQLWLNYAVLVNVLHESDLQKFCHNFRHAVVEENRETVKEALKVVLRNLDTFHHNWVVTQIASFLVSEKKIASLWPLSSLTASELLLDTVWDALVGLLTHENAQEVLASLATLSTSSRQYMIEHSEVDHSSAIVKSMERCLQLHNWILGNNPDNLPIVRSVASVVRNLVGTWTPHMCESHGEKFAVYYVQGNGDAVFPPITGPLLDHHPTLVVLLEAILGWFVTLKIQLEPVVRKLIGLMLVSADNEIQASTGRLIAAFLNKISSDEELARVLTFVDDNLRPKEFRAHAYVAIWIAKALAMRGYTNLKIRLERLSEYLTIWTSEISADWTILFQEQEASLCPSSHALIKLLYRQRLFSLVVPLLINAFQNASNEQKSVYLAALACQLPYVSKPVLLPHLPKLVPVLLESLARSQETPELLRSTLSALKDLLKESPTVLTDAAGSLVTRLINLTLKSNYWRLRREALDVLYLTANLPSVVLLPLRNEVLNSTTCCLDDKKRFVRQEAAKMRNRWFLIGQPGGLP